ncbi:MAG: hypothetical protein IKD79_01670 [Oscillospiraceae bacterium]|nr:hypothetical protein [Oscillospiraceae bacterium]
MAQERFLFDNTDIVQPDDGLGYDFETTYSEDTTRVMSGALCETALFTVEALSFKASNIPLATASALLRAVTGRRFSFHYLSAYYGTWRTDTFYVGKGSLSIGPVLEGGEKISSVQFNIVGVNPIA